MFEAVILVCATSGTPCREMLLPGYEAASAAGCQEALSAEPPDLGRFGPLRVDGVPECRDPGEALDFAEVSPGLHVHAGQIAEWNTENRGDVANIAFVVGEDSVAVVDPGSARWMGEAVWRAIRAVTDRPVSHVILTHMHPDHALGAAPLAEAGAEVVGHAMLERALSDRRDSYLARLAEMAGPDVALGTDMVPVDITVSESLTLDLGGRILDLQAWPSSHTSTDVTVFDRQSGILIAGDLVFDTHTPSLDGSLRGWQEVTGRLTDMDLSGLVPGHGETMLGWPEGGAAQTRYLDVLAEDTRAAIDRGARLGDAINEVAESEADDWQLFEVFNPRNATVAFTELEWE